MKGTIIRKKLCATSIKVAHNFFDMEAGILSVFRLAEWRIGCEMGFDEVE